ncbi:acyl-CoA thioesterase [Aliiroseovarius sp.]|uniref:acyl-CoA thioesterase n=1 Tax=Aliiroseovarius sp. TaxID=1872442 RepID=UPI003BAA9F8A
MYPIFRLAKDLFKHRKPDGMSIFDTHVSHHICWPWDLDLWMELNNGRTLTLYDLGRVPMGGRVGFSKAVLDNKWGIAVAGGSIRYRKRVTAFQRIEMKTRLLGWDERFFYIEQSMWVKGACTSHVLLRTAVTSKGGAVPTAEVAGAMNLDPTSPTLPDWAEAWIAADSQRPWPPEM